MYDKYGKDEPKDGSKDIFNMFFGRSGRRSGKK